MMYLKQFLHLTTQPPIHTGKDSGNNFRVPITVRSIDLWDLTLRE